MKKRKNQDKITSLRITGRNSLAYIEGWQGSKALAQTLHNWAMICEVDKSLGMNERAVS